MIEKSGSHTVSAPTSRARLFESSAFPLSALIPNIPQALARQCSLRVEERHRGGASSTPKVEAEPHVFTYELSGFSG